MYIYIKHVYLSKWKGVGDTVANYNMSKLLLTTAEYVHVYMQSWQEKMIVFDFFAVFVMASVHRVVVRWVNKLVEVLVHITGIKMKLFV